MSACADITGELWQDVEITVKLRGIDGKELTQYSPQTIKGEWNGSRLVYPPVEFHFGDGVDMQAAGYYCEANGREIHSQTYPRPVRIIGGYTVLDVYLGGKPKG